jgi:beta-fructofuranosidase
MWECPDFFALGTKHVLLYSTAGSVIWQVGELDPKELVFHVQNSGILDHGAYYAQKTQVDSDGNRILWGWIPERRPEAEFSAAGWAGCMSLPRYLSIGADGDLEMRVAPISNSLRVKAFVVPQQHAAQSERSSALKAIRFDNLCGELAWKTKATSSTFQLEDRAGPWWSLHLEPQGSSAKLTVNGVSVDVPTSSKSAREFHLFLDASVAELICDRKHAVTTRIYRQPDGPLHIALSDSDLTQITSLQAWQLRAISKDRLTS